MPRPERDQWSGRVEDLPSWQFSLEGEAGRSLMLRAGVRTRIVSSEKLMLSVVEIAPHTPPMTHAHVEEQWGVLLEGRCWRQQGEEEIEMDPGSVWWTPSNTPHSIRTEQEGARVLDMFVPPRPGYLDSAAASPVRVE